MPDFDRAFAGLITDLDQRGLLDSTLVVVNSEFGRTPKINAGGGRDHWPRVFSIILAGGGIKRGQVYGASDALAAEPARIAAERRGLRPHGLPPARHRRPQGPDVARQPPAADRHQRPGRQGPAGLTTHRWSRCAILARLDARPSPWTRSDVLCPHRRLRSRARLDRRSRAGPSSPRSRPLADRRVGRARGRPGGSEFTVLLTGGRLKGAAELLLYDPD